MGILCVRRAICPLSVVKGCPLKGKSKQRIGIYAGAFDPIHEGHIAFAKEALQKAHLDRIYFLVEARPRYKQGVKALDHRVAMVEQAISNEPHLGLVLLDQARFTVYETWPLLQSRFEGAQLFMLMGEDVFNRLTHWPRIEGLVTSAEFVVGLRTGHSEEGLREHFSMLAQTKALELHYEIFRANHSQVNSRHIRASLRRGKIPEGLHPDVLAYIKAHRLYASELSA
jgi:nicotinate-nucleotide adenylyltransferase